MTTKWRITDILPCLYTSGPNSKTFDDERGSDTKFPTIQEFEISNLIYPSSTVMLVLA